MMGNLSFAELREAGKLHKIDAATAIAQLTELARILPPQIMERHLNGEATSTDTRMMRRNGLLLAETLANMVIQIDKFAAMNGIDLADHVRRRLEIPE